MLLKAKRVLTLAWRGEGAPLGQILRRLLKRTVCCVFVFTPFVVGFVCKRSRPYSNKRALWLMAVSRPKKL